MVFHLGFSMCFVIKRRNRDSTPRNGTVGRSLRDGGERSCKRTKDIAAVARSQQVFAGSLGMRHQSEYVTRAIANAGNIIARAIWIRSFCDVALRVAVTKNYPIFFL